MIAKRSWRYQLWRLGERHAITLLPKLVIIFVLCMSAVFPQMSASELDFLKFSMLWPRQKVNSDHSASKCAHRALISAHMALTTLPTFRGLKKSDHRALTSLPWRVFFLIWRVALLYRLAEVAMMKRLCHNFQKKNRKVSIHLWFGFIY